MIKQLLIVIGISTVLLGCSTPEYLSEEALKAYVLESENGVTKKHETNGFQSIVTLRPNDLLILQETRGEVEVDSTTLKKLSNKYKDYYYFILSLSKESKEAEYQTGKGFGQFSDVVQTLSFRMADYVNLTTNTQDTIPVGDYIYPRTFGMSNASTLMFAFNKEKTIDKEWIQFNMKEFGLGIGNQNFRFKIEDLTKVPKINFVIKDAKN